MKVLMVCLGNICRSPLAEGLLKHKIAKNNLDIVVDSAGTAGYHIGAKPDTRMCETAKKFGVPIDDLHARQFKVNDFDIFDLIYAMDEANYQNIVSLARSNDDKEKVSLILNESNPGKNLEVPDPYYGGDQGFIDVFKMLDDATDAIIKKIR